MTNKKSAQKYGYLLAFIFGFFIMVVMYIVFELTTKSEYRIMVSGDIDTNPQVGQIYDQESASSPIVKTSSKEEELFAAGAFLGVEVISVNSVIAEQLNIESKNGVLVNNVIPDSAAQQAGLQRGDVIISLDNRAVKNVDTLAKIIRELNPGDKVRIIYVRDSRRNSTYALLSKIPSIQRTAQVPELNEWGVSLSPLSSTLRQSLQIPSDINGIAILSVTPGANADKSGFMPGDIITGVDKAAITDMDDFFKAIVSDKDNTALLDIYSQGRRRYVPMDSSSLKIAEQLQTQDTTTLRQRLFSVFTGGMPFSDDEEEEQAQTQDTTTLRQRLFSVFTGGMPFSDDEEDEGGPKGGKFADDNISLTADNVAFNRPSSVPGDTNTGGLASTSSTGMNRPSEVPPQSGGPINDIVLFIGLLLIIIIYLAYREFHRPLELD